MFLEEISNPCTIVEAPDNYGRKLYFDYRKTEKGKELLSSPSPMVLYLGTWRMTDKQGSKKKFICGLNLAYLADENELAAVRQALPEILKTKNMKTRYKIGSNLLPDIFHKAYRTYNINNVVARPVRGRLYALKPSEDDTSDAKEFATKDGEDWDGLDNQRKNQYLDQAVRKRGSEDVKRQERSKKERDQINTYIDQEKEGEAEEEAEEKPEDKLAAKPRKPSKPQQPQPPKKPSKPKAFQQLGLGPGYEPTSKPEPEDKPESAIQLPAQSIGSGMVTPQKIITKKPQPETPEIVDRDQDDA